MIIQGTMLLGFVSRKVNELVFVVAEAIWGWANEPVVIDGNVITFCVRRQHHYVGFAMLEKLNDKEK